MRVKTMTSFRARREERLNHTYLMNDTQIGLNSLYIMHIRRGGRAAEGRSFYFTFNSEMGDGGWGLRVRRN